MTWADYDDLLQYECDLICWEQRLKEAGKEVQAKNLACEKFYVRSRRKRLKRKLEVGQKEGAL